MKRDFFRFVYFGMFLLLSVSFVSSVPENFSQGPLIIKGGFDADLSISTEKDSYKLFEQIKLTTLTFKSEEKKKDIAREIKSINFVDKESSYFNENQDIVSDSDFLKEQEYDGFIVELEGDSILERKDELVKTAVKSHDLKSGVQGIASREIVSIESELKTHVLDLKSNSDRVKSEILSKIDVAKKSPNVEDYNLAFNGFYLNVSEEEIKDVEKISGVKAVYPNYIYYLNLYDSVSLVNADDAWEKNKVNDICPKDSKDGCYTGKGVTIGIIDSGINYKHPDFGSCSDEEFYSGNCEKVVGGWNAIDKSSDIMDFNGHGTHCASIAASDGELKGVAPDAKLYALKVSKKGTTNSVLMIKALERAIDLDGDGNPMEDEDDYLDVLSISIGGSSVNVNSEEELIVEKISNAGVPVVIAAGNDGELGGRTVNSPGISRGAITVGSHKKKTSFSLFGDSEYVSSFSSIGPVYYKDKNGDDVYFLKPDVVAPGDFICAAQFDKNYRSNKLCFDENHVVNGGTSMATPHVAGIVALLKQKNPNLTSDEIRMIIKESAFFVDYDLEKQGSGKVNVERALSYISSGNLKNLVNVDNVSVNSNGNVKVYGFLDFLKGYKYSVYYRIVGEKKWRKVCSGEDKVNHGLICDFNVDDYGKYQLKVEVASPTWFWKKYKSYGVFQYGEAVKIVNIINDGYFNGDLLKVYGNIYGDNLTRIEIKYRKMGDKRWEDSGVEYNNVNDFSGMKNFYLGNIDFSLFDNSKYEIMLRAYYGERGAYLEDIKRVSRNVLVKENSGIGTVFNNPKNSLVYDFNQDGKEEIIVFDFLDDVYVYVYDYLGNLIMTFDLKIKSDDSLYSASIPVLADYNGDGFKEIVFYLDSMEKFYFLDKDGGIESFSLSLGETVAISSGDLDRDGDDELVIEYGKREYNLIVLDDGEIIFEFSPENFIKFDKSPPSLGNFDDDSDLEIVVSSPYYYGESSKVFVFNYDGSLVDGWPVVLDGRVCQYPLVGDLDLDLDNEIVVISRQFGTYFLDKKGEIIFHNSDAKGCFKDYSLADMNNDGKLEAIIPSSERSIFILDSEGNSKVIDFLSGSSIVSDLHGDGKSEIVSARGNNGIYSFGYDGNLLGGFPILKNDKNTKFVVSDLEGDGVLDLVSFNFNGVYIFEFGKYDEQYLNWPMYKHDFQYSGNYNFEKESFPMQSSGRNVSRIVNNDDYIKGTVTMELQRKGEHLWETREKVVDEYIALPPGKVFYLGDDEKIGWNNKVVRANLQGKYRIYFNFENEDRRLTKYYYFRVSDDTQCADLDDGDIYAKSSALNLTGIYNDTCLDSKSLKEFDCFDNSLVENIYECENGCLNGACLRKNVSLRNRPNAIWSEWFNVDNPNGEGDFEYSSNYLISSKICENPIALECRTIDGKGYLETGENVQASLGVGCYCVNSEQEDGVCNFDYKVRFLCSTEEIHQNIFDNFLDEIDFVKDPDFELAAR